MIKFWLEVVVKKVLKGIVKIGNMINFVVVDKRILIVVNIICYRLLD